MDTIFHKSLRTLFEDSCSHFEDNPFLYYVKGKGYTYGEFKRKTEETDRLLANYGVGKGALVGLVAQNMPNWAVAYFSATAFGRIIVPMLPDFSESEIRHILKHSETKALFVSKKLLPKISEKTYSRMSLIVCLDDFSIIKGEPCTKPEVSVGTNEIAADDLAAIIYTSGTTGSSKGVMLTHKNLCANLYSSNMLRPSYSWDIWLSLLPLSHTLESSMCMLLPMLVGATVYYIEKIPTPTILMNALSVIRPTTVLSVPLIIEKIYKTAILPQMHKNRFMAFLYSIPPFRKLMNRAAGKKLLDKFGGRIRFFGIGGAKLDPIVEKFLIEAKFPYAIGYGLTETSPLIAGAPPHMVKLGSTGPVVSGVEVKLLDKNQKTGIGEIVVKGANVMQGYYKNPEATADAFTEDGWFRTKDLGMFDKKGWLYIKGRSSTTIIGPSGENIYPEEVESIINSHDLVEESLVTTRKGKLTALVHFNSEKLQAFLDAKDELKRSTSEKLENLKKEILDYVNQKVSKFSKISEVKEHVEEFEKTATKKIKRFLYDDPDSKSKKK